MAKDLTLDEAWDAIFEEFGLPPIDRDAGEFTVSDYSLELDIPYNTAAKHLAKAVHAGLLTKRDVISNGKRCNAYKITAKN